MIYVFIAHLANNLIINYNFRIKHLGIIIMLIISVYVVTMGYKRTHHHSSRVECNGGRTKNAKLVLRHFINNNKKIIFVII